ncbi:MAG: CPBP family intramembrane metalloprotease [Clostridiales bacterium]|nr:CPBP family intramembrane metalloprotease [Clostridiales bacterium]
MEQLSNQKKLRPWMGFVAQICFLVLFLTAGAWMQRNLGIAGLVCSELMFLVVAVFYCLIRKVKLKEMFPMKKFTVAEFFGTAILGVAGFMLSLLCVGFSLAVLPKSYRAEVTGLSEYIYGNMNLPMLILIVTILPAICEEAMERGCVLSHFRSIKKDWVIVLIMGIFFGIMHWSPLRFLNTAVLGAMLSYVMVKKNNILLPMILHFGNNFVSVVLGYLGQMISSGNTADLNEVDMVQLMGSYLFLSCAAPVLIVTAMMLIDREHHKATRFIIGGCLSGIMFFAGITLLMFSSVASGAV